MKSPDWAEIKLTWGAFNLKTFCFSFCSGRYVSPQRSAKFEQQALRYVCSRFGGASGVQPKSIVLIGREE